MSYIDYEEGVLVKRLPLRDAGWLEGCVQDSGYLNRWAIVTENRLSNPVAKACQCLV